MQIKKRMMMDVYKLVNILSSALLLFLVLLFGWIVYSDAEDLVEQKRWFVQNEKTDAYLDLLDSIDQEIFATMRFNHVVSKETENVRRLQILQADKAFMNLMGLIPNQQIYQELYRDLQQQRQDFERCMQAFPKCRYDIQQWGISQNNLQVMMQNDLQKHQESYAFNSHLGRLKDLSQQITRWTSQFHRLLTYIELYQKEPTEPLRKMILDLSLVLGESSIYLNSDTKLIEKIPVFWKQLLEFSSLYQELSQQIVVPLQFDRQDWLKPVSITTLNQLSRMANELRNTVFDRIQSQSKQVYDQNSILFIAELMIAFVILILLVFVIFVIRNAALLPLAQNEAILNDAVIGIIQLDRKGRIFRVNRQAEKIFGYVAEELEHQSILTLIPVIDRREIEESLKPYLQGDTPHQLSEIREIEGLRKDASTVPIEMRISELQVGTKKQFILLITDLTEQKRARRSVSEHNQFLDTLKGVSEYSVTHPTEVSQNLQRLTESLTDLVNAEFGFFARVYEDEDKETYMALEGLVHQKDKASADSLLNKTRNQKLFKGSRPNLHELFTTPRHARDYPYVKAIFDELLCPLPYEHQIILPLSENQEVFGLVGFAGIEPFSQELESFLKPLESTCNILLSNAHFHALQNELIEQLEERKDQAEEAQKDAEIAAQAKSSFLANMSHEIRTPMNAVIGLTHLLLKTELTSTQKDKVEKIDRASHSLLGIINDILDFSKIESGKLALESISFNLEEMVRNLIETLKVTVVKPIDLSLSYDVIPDNREFLGDELRLNQVLTNLLSNAIKFTEKGSVELKVSNVAEVVEHQKCVLRFEVKDTGIGITKDIQENLFEEFIQADQSTTRKFGGTGLGLTISQRFVGLMGGGIQLESEVGQGSTFWFEIELPIGKPVSLPMEQLQTLEGDSKEFINWRLLVVEDNIINQEITTELLTTKGAEVFLAENGQEALDVLQSKPDDFFDVVLMDIQMPVMSGDEATKKIRKQIQYDQLPIIAMTAHAFGDEVERCLTLGMQDYVTKPVVPKQLYKALRNVKLDLLKL